MEKIDAICMKYEDIDWRNVRWEEWKRRRRRN